MKKSFLVGLWLICCFSIGCAGWEPIDHTPDMLEPADELPAQMKRIIEEQRGGAPLNLVVTEEKISADVISATQYSASASNMVVYFDRVETIELFQKKETFSVLVKGKNDKLLLRLLAYDVEEAKHIVDVTASLVQRAKNKN